MIPLVEAIDWLLIGWERLRVPWCLEGRFILCVNKRIERIILSPIESISASGSLWITPRILLVLLSWIHTAKGYAIQP